jgi:hypothetical protein
MLANLQNNFQLDEMLTLLNNIVWNVTFLAAVPVDCALVG